MKTTSAVAMLAALILSTSARAADPAKPAAPPAKSSGPELKTEDDKTLYAMGLAISRQIGAFNLSASELDRVEMFACDECGDFWFERRGARLTADALRHLGLI